MTHDHHQSERGAATGFVMLMTIALLVGAGLVIDGGYALAARRSLTHQAEQAARSGAGALDQNSLRDAGAVRVDPQRARAAASNYLAAVDAPPADIQIDGDTVTITLTTRHDTTILSVVGMTSLPVTATASATSVDEND